MANRNERPANSRNPDPADGAGSVDSRDISSHMDDYRADQIDRYEPVRTTGDIDALLVESKQ